MSKALERVQNALKADEQRHLNKAAKVESQNLGLLFDDLGDFRPHAKRGEFRKQVQKMLTLNRSLKVGVKRSNLKEWHELSKFRPAVEEDHKNFISHVLNNFQLMARFTRFMRQSGDFFLKTEELTKGDFLNFMANKLHEAKISTAHLCWHEIVKPLRSHRANLQAGVDSLKSQLRQLRSDYLKEISTLRDAKQGREDPLEAIPDIRYFYEPLHSLEKSEQKFMIDLIREVLKMMMDSPDARRRIKSSALERFVSEVHDNELQALKDEISQKNAQLKELRQAQHFLETQLLNGFRSGKESTANTLEKMLHITEEQLSTVRHNLYKLQKENQELQEKFQHLNEERSELLERLEQEIAENSILHAEISRLCSVEEEQKQTIQTLENEHIQLKETIKEQQARIETMQLKPVRRKWLNAEAKEPKEPKEDLLPGTVEEGGFLQGTHQSHHVEEFASEDVVSQVEVMQQRIADLEKLLREHLVQLNTQPAQELQEEASDLMDLAESLGCVQQTPGQVRLCRCGSVFEEKAGPFCGKCGSQWTPGASFSKTSQQLAAEISSLQKQIQNAEEVLRTSMSEAGVGGTQSSFTMTRVLAAPELEEVTQEELEQRELLLQQRKNLEDLYKAKMLAENQLLAKRNEELAKESSVEVMQELDEEAATACGCDGVNCQYRRQVEVLQEMVQTLRGLCNEMGEKLQQATGEHLQMNMALTSVQGSLEQAVQVVEQTSRDVDTTTDKAALKRMLTHVSTSLKETKRRSVFWRLYHNRGNRKRRPQSREHTSHPHQKASERRAALVHKTYEHLYKIDPRSHGHPAQGSSGSSGQPPVATPGIRRPPPPPPAPYPAAESAKPSLPHTVLPAIERPMRPEKSSKEKNSVPISPVNLFVAEEPYHNLHGTMGAVFSPRKTPHVRRASNSKRSSGH